MESKQNHIRILKDYFIPSAEFYRQMIDSLQDYAIFSMDNNLIINSWSSGAENIFGYKTEEAIGQQFSIIFTEDDIKNGAPENEIERSLADGRATDNRWHICKDGSLFYAYGVVFPLTSDDGELFGHVKILRDLTQRKKSDDAIKNYIKELEELNNHKESVLAILSHDLRSPLSRIISLTDFLKTNFDQIDPVELKEMLTIVHDSATEELNMLDYLVEWARIKYASEAFAPKKIELMGYVQKVLDALNETTQVKAITLHHEINENESVFADGKMLLSILQNIVSNAISHTKPGGTITVSAKKESEKLIVEIKDTGIGMSQELQKSLFTPQLSTLSKARKKDKGAGIGLLLVKGFLEKNGGEIWVESVLGKGTSFYFTLPLEKPEYEPDVAEQNDLVEKQ
jgi:two-component system CheB/CheR fusion protein